MDSARRGFAGTFYQFCGQTGGNSCTFIHWQKFNFHGRGNSSPPPHQKYPFVQTTQCLKLARPHSIRCNTVRATQTSNKFYKCGRLLHEFYHNIYDKYHGIKYAAFFTAWLKFNVPTAKNIIVRHKQITTTIAIQVRLKCWICMTNIGIYDKLVISTRKKILYILYSIVAMNFKTQTIARLWVDLVC